MNTEELLKRIEDAARREIRFLTTYKHTLKSEIRIEFNVSQGAVADVKLTRQTMERLTSV
jgi:hypothetical protein